MNTIVVLLRQATSASKCWDYRCGPPCPVEHCQFLLFCFWESVILCSLGWPEPTESHLPEPPRAGTKDICHHAHSVAFFRRTSEMAKGHLLHKPAQNLCIHRCFAPAHILHGIIINKKEKHYRRWQGVWSEWVIVTLETQRTKVYLVLQTEMCKRHLLKYTVSIFFPLNMYIWETHQFLTTAGLSLKLA